MLLSADGVVPALPELSNLPGLSPVDIVLVDDSAGDEQADAASTDTQLLVDTNPVVTETSAPVPSGAATQTTNTDVTLVTTITPSAPTALTPPADPLVNSAADLSVITLTSGNGPPASGTIDSDSVGQASGTEINYDPPFGGFEFTPTGLGGSDALAEKNALLALFDNGDEDINGDVIGTTVTLHGTLVQRAGDGSLGQLSLEGTFKIKRHLVGPDGAVDGAGNFVFEVWFDTALVSASYTVNGVTLTFGSTKGAFLVSGQLELDAGHATGADADFFDIGGLAGSIEVLTLANLVGAGDDAFTFAGLTGTGGPTSKALLTLNTATTGLVNATTGHTSASDIGGTGLGASFATNPRSVGLAGNVTLEITSVGLALTGNVSFTVIDTNGATAGGYVLRIGLTNGSLTLGTGIKLTATGVTVNFDIHATGVVGSVSVANLALTGLTGVSVSQFTSASFSVDTRPATPAVSISATVKVAVNHGGFAAELSGSFTFTRDSSAITFGVATGGVSVSAGGVTLTLADFNGGFLIRSDGFVGKAAGDASISGLPGVTTFTANDLDFEINTINNTGNLDLVLPVVGAVSYNTADRKKFFRIQGGVVLELDFGGLEVGLDGTFYFEQFDPDGAGAAPSVFRFAALDGNAAFAAGSITVEATGVTGGFLISDDGIAGYLDADGLDVTTPGDILTVHATDISFTINTTGAAVDDTFNVLLSGGSTVAVDLDYQDAAEYSFVSVGATFANDDNGTAGDTSDDIAGITLDLGAALLETSGTFGFYGGTITDPGTDLVGTGDDTEVAVVMFGFTGLDAFLEIGGITATITEAEGVFVLMDDKAAGRLEFEEMTIGGLSGFTFTAAGFAFEFNTTGLEINEALDIGGVSQTLQYTAAAGETDFFRGNGHLVIGFDSGGGLVMNIEGTFAFEVTSTADQGDVVKFAFEDLSFDIDIGGGLTLAVTDASGFFLFGENTAGDASYAAHLEIDAASLVTTGLSFQVTDFVFDANNFGEPVYATLGAYTLDFTATDKQDFISLGGTAALTLSMGGFDLNLTGSFFFEQKTLDLDGDTVDETITQIAISVPSFTLNVGGRDLLVATGITGAFLIKDDGTSAGKLEIASFSLPGVPGLTVAGGDLVVEFNNTGGAASVTNLQAGGVSVSFDYDDDILSLGGTLQLGLAFGSSFSTTLNGTFFFEQTATKILVGVRAANFDLVAGPLTLKVEEVNGLFALYPDDGDADTDGTIAMQLSVGQVTLTGLTGLTFAVEDFFLNYNNTGGAVTETFTFADDGDPDTDDAPVMSFTEDILSLGGTVHLGLTLGSSFSTTINGTFTFEQTATKILVGVRNADFELTAGPLTLKVEEVNGLFALYPDDADADAEGTMAMQLSVGQVSLTGITGLTFAVEDFFLNYNNTGGAVTETFTFADDGDPDTDDAPVMSFTEDILSLGGTVHLGIAFGSAFSTTINGTFMFEQTASKILVGVRDADFELVAGPLTLKVEEVNGLFALYPDDADADAEGTMAMQLSVGSVSLTGITGLTFAVEDFFLNYNNTGGAVTETFTFADDGDPDTDDAPVMSFTEDVISLGGTVHLGLAFGSAFSTTINGTFTFEQTASKILVGVRNADFELVAGPLTLKVEEVNGLFALYPDDADADSEGTMAMQLSVGSVSLTGITGLTFAVEDFFLNYNNTGGAVTETFTFADDGDPDTDDAPVMSFTEDILSLGGTVHLGIAFGSAFSTTINGTFTFEQTASKILIGVRNADFALTAGPLTLSIEEVNGLFALYPDDGDADTEGTIAMQLSVGSVSLTGITGLTFAVEDFFLNYNNTGGAVTETFTFADDGDPDTDDAPVMSFTEDILSLGGTVHLGIAFGSAFSTTINGTFTFEQTASKILIGVRNADFELAAGPLVLKIEEVNGLFALYPDDGDADTEGTMAMQLSVGSVSVEGITGLTFTVEDFFLNYNNTGGAVTETFTFADDGDPDTDDAPVMSFTEDILSLGGTVNLELAFGASFATTIEGTFFFEQTASRVLIAIRNAGMTIEVGLVKFEMSGINGLFALYPDDGDADTEGTLAMSLEIGLVALTGIPGVSLSVQDFFLELNDAGDIAPETFTFADDGDAATPETVTLDYAANALRLGGTVIIKIGGTPAAPFLRLTALNVEIDTGATGSGHVFSAELLSGELTLSGMGTIVVEASNLAVTAEGKLANRTPTDPFVVEVSFGGTGPAAPNATTAFQWPSWFPIKIQKLVLLWSDIEAAPADFDLILSATVDLAIPGITFSGMVENLRIDVGNLLDGDSSTSPIDSFTAASVTITGNLFGLAVSGGIVLGMIELRADDTIIDRADPAQLNDVAVQKILYAGLSGSIAIAGMAGAGFRIGLAELNGEIVPLEAFISVDIPVIIEPISGLTLGGFFGGIQFATDLSGSNYDDIAVLKTITIDGLQNPTAAQWNARLKAATLKIFLGNDEDAGPADIWSEPMVITASVEVYSSYISKQALLGELLVQFDTEGRLLLLGDLTFGGGSLLLATKFFVDFTNTSDIKMTFYASYGATNAPMKQFEVWGELTIEIFEADGVTIRSSADTDPGLLRISLLNGGAQFNTGPGVALKVQGELIIEVDYRVPATTKTSITFAVQVSMVVPPGAPNPLGANFGELAGTVIIIDTGTDFFMYGALALEFNPASLAQYGLDVGVNAAIQLNTTTAEHDVTLTYYNGDTETVTLAPESFKLFLKGEVAVFPPGGDAADALFTMEGFLILQFEDGELTVVVDADMVVAPGGTTLLTLEVSGFMRVSEDGVAARLLIAADPEFPPSAGIELEATLTLVVNTTGEEVTYTIPDWFYTITEVSPGVFEYVDVGGNVHDAAETITIPKSPPQLGADLSVPADPDAAGGLYFVIGIDGTLEVASAGLVLDGNFFMLITADEVQLQIDATLQIGDPVLFTFDANGYMVISDAGVAARLDLEFATGSGLPGGLGVEAELTMVVNTTGVIVSYVADGATITIPEGAPALGSDLTTIASGGSAGDYFVVELDGTVTLDSVGLVLDGYFFLLVDGSDVQIAVDAELQIGDALTFDVEGFMAILSDPDGAADPDTNDGVAARLDLTFTGTPPGGLQFDAAVTFTLIINTTGTDVSYTLGGTPVTIPATLPQMDDFEVADANAPPGPYFIVAVEGILTVTDGLVLEGMFFISVAGDEIQLAIDADLQVGPAGDPMFTFTAEGYMLITSDGVAARLDLTFGGTLPGGMGGVGLGFTLIVNTTGEDADYTIDGDTVVIPGAAPAVGDDLETAAAGSTPGAYFVVVISGELTLSAGLVLDGTFFIIVAGNEVQLAINADVQIGDLFTFTATGFLAIVQDPDGATDPDTHDGVAARLDLTIKGTPPAGLTFVADFTLIVNTTGAEAAYTLDGDTITIPAAAPALGGDLEVAAAGGTPGDYFLVMVDGTLSAMDGALLLDGYFGLLVDGTEVQLVVKADLKLGPAGAPIFTFSATGFLAVLDEGIAARLDLTLTSTPPAGLTFTVTFQLVVNTTGLEVDYTVPDGSGGTETITIADSAPALGGPLDTPANTTTGFSEDYVVVAASGSLTALSTFSFAGDFFLVVTFNGSGVVNGVQLQLNASFDFDPVGTLDVSGFLDVTAAGAAGMLSIDLATSPSLASYGLAVTGSFNIAFNTRSTAYALPAAVITQFGLPVGTTLAAGLIRLEISGSVSLLSGAFTLSGRFLFEKTTTTTRLEVDATMTLPVIGTMTVTGFLNLSTAGAVGALDVTLASSSQVAGIGSYTGTLKLRVNTTNAAVTTPFALAAETVELDLSGTLTLLSQFTFSGHFYFKKSGASTITVRFDATLTLSFLGTLGVTGSFDGTSAGFTASLTLTLQTATSINFGFSLSGTFSLAINTTGSNFTVSGVPGLGDQVVGPNGLSVFVSGDLELFSTFKLSGAFGLSVSSTQTTLVVKAAFAIFGVSALSVDGTAIIFTGSGGANQGIVLDLAVKLGGSNPIISPFSGFTISGAFYLKLNTTDIARDPGTGRGVIAANSVTLGGSLSVNLFGFTLSGAVWITVSNAGFTITVPTTDALTLDFFGFITLSVSGSFSTIGGTTFSFTASASLNIGDVDIFGFSGSISVTFSNSGFSGRLSGTFGAFGIKVSAGGDFSVGGGVVTIGVWISLQITPAFSFDIWTPWETYTVHVPALVISGSWSMTFGTLTTAPTVPPPPVLARQSGNTLLLNIGADVSHRGSFYGHNDESYTITRLGAGSITGDRVRVNALGINQDFDNITKIVATDTRGTVVDAGATRATNTFISIAPAITAAVEINKDVTATGNNRFIVGSGYAIVRGGSGKDWVEYGAAGGIYYGGPGESKIKDHVNGNLVVRAPGFTSYTLTDANLTYTNASGTKFIMNFLASNVPAVFDTADSGNFLGSSIKTVILDGAANATYETTSLPNPSTGVASPWTGTATFNGSGTDSRIRSTTSGNLTLTDTALTESGVTITLNNLTIAQLYGDADTNTFTITGWSHNGLIDGKGGNDTVIAANNVDFTLTDTSLARSGLGSFTLTAVETVNLTGGAAVNSFTVSSWSGTANLFGLGGNDIYTINLAGGASGTTNITDSSGTDTLVINGTANADTLTLAGGTLTRTGSETVTYSGIETFTINGNGGNDTITVNSTALATTVNGGAGDDNLTLAGNTHAVTFNGDADHDTFVITGSGAGATLNGNDGNDIFNLRAVGAAATINTGAGTNTVNVGSAAPGLTGTVNAINGVLTINGDGTSDTLNVGDGGAAAKTGQLTGTQITGLGMTGGRIDYSNVEILGLTFGSGDDTFTIISTHVGTTTVNAGGGADRINVRTISGATTLNLGAGVDTVYVGTNAGVGDDTGGTLNSIAAALTVNDGVDATTLILDDTGDTGVNTGTLTGTTLTGLFAPAGNLTYGGLTTLTVNLGTNGDTFTIASTHGATTNLNTNNGTDTILVRTVAGATNVYTGNDNDIVRVGSQAGTANASTLNGISALLTLNGGTGTNQFFLDDALDGAGTPNTGTLTGTTLRDLGMAAGIDYAAFASLQLTLGQGNDTFTITSTHAGTTALDLGLGNDNLTIVSIAGTTTVTGNTGDDTLRVNLAPTGDPTTAQNVSSNPIGAVLNLDGNAGSDTYLVGLSGHGASVINVHDTGNPATETNNLVLYGTPSGDTFLLRKDFVALLQYVADVQQGTYERINYNSNIDGTLTIHALAGVNYFALDDTSSETVINGGNEGDTFQVGQVYGEDFFNSNDPDLLSADLIESTRGWLSHGVSRALTVNAGSGNDTFSIYHNRATLALNGNDGDDRFIVRAFAMAGSTEGTEVYDPLRGATNVATGGGTNQVEYAVNAPVTIAGGGGFDSVVIIATEFGDSIVLTQAGVYGAGLFVEFNGVESLVVHGAEGNDRIWVLGTPAGTAVTIVGGLGSDTVHLGGQADPITVAVVVGGVATGATTTVTFANVTDLSAIDGPLFIDGGFGDGIPPLLAAIGLPGEVTGPLPDNNNPNLTVDEDDQVDRLMVHNIGTLTGQVGVLTPDRLHGLNLAAAATIAGNAFPAGVRYAELEEVVVLLGSGDDTFTIEGTHAGRTLIYGNDGNDTVNVRAISGHTAVFGGNQNDTINVGSLAPATGGNLDSIDALLTLEGGAGTDTVNTDQRGNTAGSTGWLTQTTLTGLEMTSVLATVNDTITLRVNATSGSFTLSHGAATPETLAWNATADDLTAALWRLLGNRNAFALQVGGEFLINFQGALEAQAVNLGVTGDVTVTHRIAGVNYYGIDTLNLDLGSGADVFNVQGTAAGTVTNLNTHDGHDRIYVSSAASLTTATTTDFLLGNLDAITGTLNINAGLDRNLLMISDEAATVADGTAGTPVVLTNNSLTGLAPAVITFQAAGDFTQGITIWAGSGADFINVTSTDLDAGVRTITTLNTGAGADTVTVSLSAASDGFFVLNTQAGADTVDATASSLPLVIFGGEGIDTLRGGSGDDLIFGDNGRVHYLNGATVVAVLGGGGPGDSTDGVIRNNLTFFTVDSSIGSGDFLYGNDGHDVILGGAGGDTIDAGEGDNFVAGDHAQATYTAGLVVSLDSLHTGGGNDTITTGAGRDLILGGTGLDGINAGAGDNIVLGDHGTILLSGNIVTSATTVVNADGGVDTITTLGGRDFILGGEAGDIINAGEGNNGVAGDHGAFTITSTTAFSFTSADFTVGGDDTITTGADQDTIFGGAGLDGINAGNGRNVVFGDHGTVTRDTATGALTATSTAESTGGTDTITTGVDADVILGGAAGDIITSGAGDDLVFGDAGTITLASNLPVTLATTASNSGGDDTITAGDGADVVLGGDGADGINAGDGRNVVFGDHGTVDWTGALLLSATTSAAGVGGIDTITTGADDDIVFGGTAGDLITTNAGHDVVFGDQGSVSFTAGLATLLTNAPVTGGGVDDISTGLGNDVILGGDAGDLINAGAGLNTVAGDFASVTRPDLGSGPVTTLFTTLSAGQGGDDQITTGDDTDLIAGGHGSDTIAAGNGLNVILGDAGEISLPGAVLASVETAGTSTGADNITAGSGQNLILGGLGLDTITTTGGVNILLGDQGRIEVTNLTLHNATTLDAGLGANDTITTGAGSHWIFGGDAADTITAGNGFAAVFGDHGRIDLTAGGTLTLVSLEFATGGDDTITTGTGDDFILGGAGTDTINGGEGNNVAFGDHGEIIKTSAGLDLVRTLAPTQGANDTITTGAGNDVILGGAGADVIQAGAGRNLIFGDHGTFDFVANDLRTATSSDYILGGDDTINSGLGADVIFGGFAADTIDAGDGDNVVFGDHGILLIAAGVPDEARTEQSTVGSGDTITTGVGADVILGGLGDDTIEAGAGDDAILGDHGELHWVLGILARLLSTDYLAGGFDSIMGGTGADMILAGPGEDEVDAGAGDDFVIGDNGFIYRTNGVIDLATTEDVTGIGDADLILGGDGDDLIFGGFGGDTINAGDGNNVIFGDNGDAFYSGGLPDFLQTFVPADAGNDTITSGSGRDLILAGQGSDTVSAGDDSDLVLGDEGSITLGGGTVQEVISESFSEGAADTISGEGGDDYIIGGNGADTIHGGEGNNVIAGDNARFTLPGGTLVQLEILAPAIGAADNITAGAGDDVIVAGAAGDTVNAGDGHNVVAGDQATVTFAGGMFATLTPTTPEIGGNDTITTGAGADRIVGGTGADWINGGDGHNVVVGDHAVILQPLGALGTVEAVAPADGGADLIFTGAGNDLVLGGTAGDIIHAGAGNDLVFGDHALVTGAIDLALLPLAMAAKPFTFTATVTQNVDADGRSVAGDDVVFAGTGDDIVFGQQGDDILFGEDGDDDLVGGHNVSLGQDGADVIDGGAGFDVLAGDNAAVLRTGTNISPRAHVLAGTALFDDRGTLLDLDDPQAWPTAVPVRALILLDHAFDTIAGVFGADQLVGGAGDDEVFGQLGNDSLHGDATLPVDIAADGTVDRAAIRAVAAALFSTNLWVGADSDGDDYLEGNGGNDLMFGGLGQDDMVGGSSALFGLSTYNQRPDGADTIYGGNGTAAGFEDMGDASLNGRARDADVIMGDNANIFRLVGLNGVSIGAFLTFSYDAAGTVKIIVRAFDLLDYTVPESPTDIGDADTIYGEAGDDTLHGQVGADLLLGNGNDDNLYGGQGDDNAFGGGGDDAISHSDELKPPPPAENRTSKGPQNRVDPPGGPGATLFHVASNVPAALFITPGVTMAVYLTDLYLGFSTAPSIRNTSGQINPDGGSSWRIFSSDLFARGRFDTPASLVTPLPAAAPVTEIPPSPEGTPEETQPPEATPPPAPPRNEKAGGPPEQPPGKPEETPEPAKDDGSAPAAELPPPPQPE